MTPMVPTRDRGSMVNLSHNRNRVECFSTSAISVLPPKMSWHIRAIPLLIWQDRGVGGERLYGHIHDGKKGVLIPKDGIPALPKAKPAPIVTNTARKTIAKAAPIGCRYSHAPLSPTVHHSHHNIGLTNHLQNRIQ